MPNTLDYWIDKHGAKIKITEMTDKHLNCTIRQLESFAEERASKIPRRLQEALCVTKDSEEEEKIKTEIRKLQTEGINPSLVNPRYGRLCLEQFRREGEEN